MGKWLAEPHVLQWYHDPEAWISEIEGRRGEYSFIRHFIVEEEGIPFAFCQYYDYSKGGESWHGSFPSDGAYSIDYMIGEPSFLSKGYAPRIIEALSALVFSETAARSIIVQPEEGNLKSRRALLAAGYLYDSANDLYFVRR